MATTPNLGLETIEMNDKANTSMLAKMNNNFSKIDAAYKVLEDNLIERTGQSNLKEAIDYIDNLVNAEDGTITPDKVVDGYIGYKGQERIVGTAFSERTTGTPEQLLNNQTLYDNKGDLITGAMPNKSGSEVASANGVLAEDTYKIQISENGYYDTSTYITRGKSDVVSELGIKTIPKITITFSANNSTTSGYITAYGAGIDEYGTLVIWAMSGSTAYEHIRFNNTAVNAGTIGLGWNITSFDTSDPISVPYACTISGLGEYSDIKIGLYASGSDSTNDYVQIQVTLTAS